MSGASYLAVRFLESTVKVCIRCHQLPHTAKAQLTGEANACLIGQKGTPPHLTKPGGLGIVALSSGESTHVAASPPFAPEGALRLAASCQ